MRKLKEGAEMAKSASAASNTAANTAAEGEGEQPTSSGGNDRSSTDGGGDGKSPYSPSNPTEPMETDDWSGNLGGVKELLSEGGGGRPSQLTRRTWCR
jgi:hypothetical protein